MVERSRILRQPRSAKPLEGVFELAHFRKYGHRI